jgi:DNA-binding transcriptional ArsR family regulator
MSRSNRKNKGSVSERRLDLVFGALSDRTRRTLLARLARGPAMITELAEPFGISLPAVSRHIRVLERAELVERTIEGRVHRCSLRAEPLGEAEKWLAHYREFWMGTLDALARHVQKPDSNRLR